ncbi:MAG: hypothetical protein ACRENP_02220 [Longimicrobiales bacterium]
MSHDVRHLADMPLRRLDPVPNALRLGAPILIVLGVVVFIAAAMMDAPRALRAYHYNWLFFTTIAQGAVTLAAVVTITRGLWSRPIRRIALAFAAFLPVAYLLILPILLGARHIFPWVEHPVQEKVAYLNVPFMSARILVLLGILFTLDLVFVFWSLRPDVGRALDEAPEKLRSLYARFTQRWQGQELEEVRSHKKLAVLAPVIALFWALGFGVMAWDFVMSLEPHWFSTMIGPYVFMSGFLGGIAATALACVLYVTRAGQGDVIRPTNFHDLGKMTFGFCVFWAYLYYSQFIVIWYGLLPIEQDWLIHRLSQPFLPIMIMVFICMFVLPFFGLLGVAPKRNPKTLAFFASIVLFGLWIERYTLVYPSYAEYRELSGVPFGWQEIGIALGFLGIVLACVSWFASRFPLYQMWQPMSEVELLGVPAPEPAQRQRI